MEQHPLFKYLPKFIRSRIEGRPEFQRVLGNSGWLFADRLFRLIVGLLVGVWVARYLGPEKMGIWNYSIALTAIAGAIAGLGMDGIVIRELVRRPQLKHKILGTVFLLRVSVAFITWLSVSLFTYFTADDLSSTAVIIICSGLIFQSLDVIDLYFQSLVKGKYTVRAKSVGFLVTTLIRILLVLRKAPLEYFLWNAVLDLCLGAAFLFITYKKNFKSEIKWQFDKTIALSFFRSAFPILLMSLFTNIQAYADQLILKYMVSKSELGQYSVAMNLVGLFGFIPMAIYQSVSPSVTKAKTVGRDLYLNRLLKLYRSMFVLFILTAIPILFLGRFAILFLYGAKYEFAGVLFSVLSLRLLFTNFGTAKGIFILNENLFGYSLITSLVGAFVNILFNFILIPPFGVWGAFYSFMISFALSTFIIDLFYKRTSENALLMLKAMLFRTHPKNL